MFQSQARSQSTGDQAELFQVQALPEVSISGEKPIHWRLRAGILSFQGNLCFNLRREANPLATSGSNLDCATYILFQSQARSQSTGDASQSPPAPHQLASFNLRREANPLATANIPMAARNKKG